jgi:hypothetical protein
MSKTANSTFYSLLGHFPIGILLGLLAFFFAPVSGVAAASDSPRALIARHVSTGAVFSYELRCSGRDIEPCELLSKRNGQVEVRIAMPREKAVALLKEYLHTVNGGSLKSQGPVTLEWEVRCEGRSSSGRKGRNQHLPEVLGRALAILEAEFSSAISAASPPAPAHEQKYEGKAE